jgi:hypothetical protein
LAARATFSQKWKLALSVPEDLTWRRVVELFGQFGRSPSLAEIGGETDLSPDQVRAHLVELHAHDLLGMDQATGEIVYAYPFTNQVTEHHIALHGRALHALCSIDALGIGGMLQTDVAITSSCRLCQTPVEIATANAGRFIANAKPDDAVVWYDLGYAGTAAMSCYPSIGFFCSDGHLQQWLAARNPPRAGSRLTLVEAMELGRAIFEPVLATP